MAGRSLQLSEPGQQQARRALMYLGLTQKALAYEQAIASWSTVNKFFNGKPVERLIFQEICHVLGLDWQVVVEKPGARSEGVGESESEVVSPTPQPSSTSAQLLTSVQTQAAAAREASSTFYRLEPSFLAILLEQHGVTFLARGWMSNVSVMVKAIALVEGMRSPLLDQVLQWYGNDPAIQSLVLGVRGV